MFSAKRINHLPTSQSAIAPKIFRPACTTMAAAAFAACSRFMTLLLVRTTSQCSLNIHLTKAEEQLVVAGEESSDGLDLQARRVRPARVAVLSCSADDETFGSTEEHDVAVS